MSRMTKIHTGKNHFKNGNKVKKTKEGELTWRLY